MGNSSNCKISINVDRTKLLYFTGESVSGTVDLNIIEGKLKANEIYITLMGEIGYRTTEYYSDNEGKTLERIKYHHVPFYETKIIFSRPEAEQKQLVYNQGQYSWSFNISLTDYLPPTADLSDSYPFVRYYLEVVIDKSWYKSNKEERKYLVVFPRVNLLQNPQCLTPIVYKNQNRKNITLKATLDKSGYVPGETIQFILEIENPRKILIKNIDFSILQSCKIEGETIGYMISQTILPNIVNSKDQQIRQIFSRTIPYGLISPSYQFQGGIKETVSIKIDYFLRFAVKIEGIFTDFNVDIPIILGTEPNQLIP
jgi:hypothetical protein